MRGQDRTVEELSSFLSSLACVEALEDLGRGRRRVEPAGDDVVEQLGEALVLAERLLQPAAQAERAQGEHLVAQVAAAALGERSLGLDVRTVLVEMLDELL